MSSRQDERLNISLSTTGRLIRRRSQLKVAVDYSFPPKLACKPQVAPWENWSSLVIETGRVDRDSTVSGGLALASFLLGDVGVISRLRASITDAKEYQRVVLLRPGYVARDRTTNTQLRSALGR
jgi:hypothetical protein